MIDSDEKTSHSKWLKLVPDLINKPISTEEQMLVPDLIRSVLERLNFAEFHAARSISSDWYSNAELCIRQNPTPWLILFSYHHLDTSVSCKLFDPHGNKTYIVRDLGLDFHDSICLANSGSWFLMLADRTNFYLLNLFTRERIRLPSMEAIDGGWQLKTGKVSQYKISNAVLWVDEKSRDYLVVWNHNFFFAYHKKGYDNKSWKVFHPLKKQGYEDMVCKERKIYVLSLTRNITVYDFSGDDAPKECASFPSLDHHHDRHSYNLVVTLSGEVLIIAGMGTGPEIFNVYRMDPVSLKWIKTQSIGNEALFLDLGTTVAAKDGVGKNCIYFSNYQLHRYHRMILSCEKNICVYNIQTKTDQRFPHLAASFPEAFVDARWFFPTFGGKWLH